MDTPNIRTFTNRRSTRSILTEIPSRAAPIIINTGENPRNPPQTAGWFEYSSNVKAKSNLKFENKKDFYKTEK